MFFSRRNKAGPKPDGSTHVLMDRHYSNNRTSTRFIGGIIKTPNFMANISSYLDNSEPQSCCLKQVTNVKGSCSPITRLYTLL